MPTEVILFAVMVTVLLSASFSPVFFQAWLLDRDGRQRRRRQRMAGFASQSEWSAALSTGDWHAD